MSTFDILIKEIDLIQACIKRVEKTSFTIKGWTITLLVAILALLPENIGRFKLSMIVGALTLAFWYLDAFFLRVDKLYRWKYNWVVKNRQTGNDKDLFDLDPYNKDMILNPQNADQKIPCILSCMFSKTLMAFYVPIIILAILYVAVIVPSTPAIIFVET